jgi:hypothetical protein
MVLARSLYQSLPTESTLLRIIIRLPLLKEVAEQASISVGSGTEHGMLGRSPCVVLKRKYWRVVFPGQRNGFLDENYSILNM